MNTASSPLKLGKDLPPSAWYLSSAAVNKTIGVEVTWGWEWGFKEGLAIYVGVGMGLPPFCLLKLSSQYWWCLPTYPQDSCILIPAPLPSLSWP